MKPKLVGAAEIAEMLSGISRQRVYQLTAKKDFPAPIAVLSNGKVWAYEDVKHMPNALGEPFIQSLRDRSS